MTREKKIAGWTGSLLGIIGALLLSTQGYASDHNGRSRQVGALIWRISTAACTFLPGIATK